MVLMITVEIFPSFTRLVMEGVPFKFRIFKKIVPSYNFFFKFTISYLNKKKIMYKKQKQFQSK